MWRLVSFTRPTSGRSSTFAPLPVILFPLKFMLSCVRCLWRTNGLSSFFAPWYFMLFYILLYSLFIHFHPKSTLSYDRLAKWAKRFSIFELLWSIILMSKPKSHNSDIPLIVISSVFKCFRFIYMWLIPSASTSKLLFLVFVFNVLIHSIKCE